ncbi:DUF1376 domain-containing protein [Nisaea sp.]|uniref:DUF1376 domain-containing protein n=1 Tax=Nisaea sp. TaxID=2024842 RepID=UPI003296B88D
MTDEAITGENEDLYAELADVDLRDLGWMPLDVNRFRDCGMLSKVSDEEFVAAIQLWAAAWHQVPPASLPDDDRELAKLAGYGRALDAWQAVREGALYGFERWSDGRLHHPVIAEKALEAVEWVSKKESKKARTRERVRRHRVKLEEGKAAARAAEEEVTEQSCNADVTRYSNDPVTPCNAPTLPKQTLIEKNSKKEIRAEGTAPRQKRMTPEQRELDAEFERWWLLYPRRVAKRRARDAYQQAKAIADGKTLADGARRYSAAMTGKETEFIKHPATWLDDECWLDDPSPASMPRDSFGVTAVDYRRWLFVRGKGRWWRPGDFWPEERLGAPPHKGNPAIPPNLLAEWRDGWGGDPAVGPVPSTKDAGQPAMTH